MSQTDVVRSTEASSGEFAADTLSMIAALMKRAGNVRRRIWILPATLGATTILATSFFVAKSGLVTCHQLINGVPSQVSCKLGESGKLLSVVSATGNTVHSQVAGWFTSRPEYVWSVGTSEWFWVIGIPLSIIVSLSILCSASRTRALVRAWILAGLTGVAVILISNQLGLPIQVAHLLAVCSAVCIAAFEARSKMLAGIAAISFFAGAGLSRHPLVLLPRLSVWIDPPSQGYIAAGIVLILGSVTLYLQTRSLRWTPRRYHIDQSNQAQYDFPLIVHAI